MALTFDDGEQGFLDIGIPLLEKYRIPATSFLIGDDPMALLRARISGEYEQAGFEYIVTTGV